MWGRGAGVGAWGDDVQVPCTSTLVGAIQQGFRPMGPDGRRWGCEDTMGMTRLGMWGAYDRSTMQMSTMQMRAMQTSTMQLSTMQMRAMQR